MNDQVFFMFQSNHAIQLPKELRMELNLQTQLFNKKFDVSRNGNDLFKGFRYLWSTDINGNVNDFNQYFSFRSVGVTLRFNFNKGQKVDQKRRNAVEELNRP